MGDVQDASDDQRGRLEASVNQWGHCRNDNASARRRRSQDVRQNPSQEHKIQGEMMKTKTTYTGKLNSTVRLPVELKGGLIALATLPD